MTTLAEYLRCHSEAITDTWVEQVAAAAETPDRPIPVLRNSMPEILEHVARAAELGHMPAGLEELCQEHASVRLEEGFDLRQVVSEYRVLRTVIFDELARAGFFDGADGHYSDLVAVNKFLDAALAAVVDSYVQERQRARELFIGILGHDLRAPLHSIRMAADIFHRDAARLSERHARLAAGALRSVTQMDRMIGDLLDVARGRLGRGIPIQPEAVGLAALVAQKVDDVAAAHPDRDIRCVVSEEAVGLTGRWDPSRLLQALSNLLDNALAHGRDPIEVTVFRRDDRAVIEVTNAGAIPREVRAHLFEPFATRAVEAPQRGLGLGLYLVNAIARAHGGTVEVDSDEEGGTRFRMILPRHAPGEAA